MRSCPPKSGYRGCNELEAGVRNRLLDCDHSTLLAYRAACTIRCAGSRLAVRVSPGLRRTATTRSVDRFSADRSKGRSSSCGKNCCQQCEPKSFLAKHFSSPTQSIENTIGYHAASSATRSDQYRDISCVAAAHQRCGESPNSAAPDCTRREARYRLFAHISPGSIYQEEGPEEAEVGNT